METKKIAVACFIGGALCCAVALIFAPVYWWFGLIAGLAGGYISYEFREVRKAIPIALCAAKKGGVGAWGRAIAKARAWLSESHPFFYPAAIVAAPLFIWLAHHIVSDCTQTLLDCPLLLTIVFLPLFYAEVVTFFVFLVLLTTVPFFILAFIGARVGERCYWQPFVMIEDKERDAHVRKLNEKGYHEEPLAYLNVLRWAVIGVAVAIRFFVWTLWKHLVIGAWAAICFLGRFAGHLVVLIHSEKRVLCAIDGTLGGVASYIWLASASTSFVGQIMLVIFGGLLGAAFGVANYEIVSKRILHVKVKVV